MLDLKALLSKILDAIKVDYVVEQHFSTGSSDPWNYRKWNSGMAECWRSYSGTNSTSGAVLGGYYAVVSFNFPSGLFISEPPLVLASGRQGTGISMVCARDASKTSTIIHILTNQSGSNSLIVRLYAIGKWK